MVSRSRFSVLAVILAALTATGCARTGLSSPSAGQGRLRVVAAENFWGSIARQLGGSRVTVTSVIVSPATDPHSYEPTAADAIAFARSRLAIVNSIGYDRWASQLLAASPSSSRVVLNVGGILGLGEGQNPHQWYSPAAVQRVIDATVADYQRLDPRHAGYYEHQRTLFESRDLLAYRRLLATIRSRYAGVPVGYSESIFQPLGQALGLHLLTPYSFAKAIAEGTDVSAGDVRTVQAQARERRIAVWVYNSQNATPDVERINQIARAAGIPIVTITETLSPASDTFEQWQVSELQGLLSALHRATDR